MVTVLAGNTGIIGDINTVTVDLLCLICSINELKEEEPERWKGIVTEFKRIADNSDDNYEYNTMKQFIVNLQDLY